MAYPKIVTSSFKLRFAVHLGHPYRYASPGLIHCWKEASFSVAHDARPSKKFRGLETFANGSKMDFSVADFPRFRQPALMRSLLTRLP